MVGFGSFLANSLVDLFQNENAHEKSAFAIVSLLPKKVDHPSTPSLKICLANPLLLLQNQDSLKFQNSCLTHRRPALGVSQSPPWKLSVESGLDDGDSNSKWRLYFTRLVP